jgi:hypothetical protein
MKQSGAGFPQNDATSDNTICVDLLETKFSTRYQRKISESGEEKHVGQTTCRNIPLTLCGEKHCEYVGGPEECYDKTVVVVNDVPEESCDLVPQQTCKGVYRLVPYLKPI